MGLALDYRPRVLPARRAGPTDALRSRHESVFRTLGMWGLTVPHARVQHAV